MVTVDQIKHWIALKANLASVKKQEMAVRKKIVSSFKPLNTSGTTHTQIGSMMLTGSIGERLEVSTEDVMSLILNEAEKQCIKWSPSINKKLYDQLPPDSMLRTIVVLKLGACTLKAESTEVK